MIIRDQYAAESNDAMEYLRKRMYLHIGDLFCPADDGPTWCVGSDTHFISYPVKGESLSLKDMLMLHERALRTFLNREPTEKITLRELAIQIEMGNSPTGWTDRQKEQLLRWAGRNEERASEPSSPAPSSHGELASTLDAIGKRMGEATKPTSSQSAGPLKWLSKSRVVDASPGLRKLLGTLLAEGVSLHEAVESVYDYGVSFATDALESSPSTNAGSGN